MPEGPEAASIVSFIHDEFVGKELSHVQILKGRYINHGPPVYYNDFINALPLKLLRVDKKGKVIFLYFTNNWCIISKLGMTGWWYSTNKPDWRTEVKTVTFDFTSSRTSQQLIYSDPRSYGTLTFTQDTQRVIDELQQLAPDIMDPSTTYKIFDIRVQRLIQNKPHTPIEELLSDQKLLICGIGNYLKSEILYACKIAPMRHIIDITPNEWNHIYKTSKKISAYMLKALASKKMDAYISKMYVYSKKQDPLGNPIKTYSNKLGRTVHWVSEVQK